MARVITTARVDKAKQAGYVNALKLVGNKDFVATAMDLKGVGEQSLAYLKKIFPKSPAEYPFRGRAPLVEGWRVYMHPPKGFDPNNVGFTLQRDRVGGFQGQERDAQIIAALDKGSKAYTRQIPKGQISSLFVTDPQSFNPALAAIGDTVFLTGNNELLRFKARRGLHFMDRTYAYTLKLIAKARTRYAKLAKQKIKNRNA